MITRDQFEARVMAEAAQKHPHRKTVTGIWDRTVNEVREAYIASRMEHEWPLVEMLQDAKGHVYSSAMLSNGYSRADRLYKRIEATLSPYATKPIEP